MKRMYSSGSLEYMYTIHCIDIVYTLSKLESFSSQVSLNAAIAYMLHSKFELR